MSTSLAFRQARHLSTTTSGISISMAKYKLKAEHDPDKALNIYSSVISHNTFPLSSRYTLDLTVKRLAKSRSFSDIETLIESHKNDPKITQEPFLSTLIRSYGTATMFDHALRTYNQMEELNTPRSVLSFNALLMACTLSRNFKRVSELFDEMPKRFGFKPDKFSYGILVKSYCWVGEVDMAIKTILEMEEKGIGVTSVTCTTLLSGLQKMGKTEEAENVWKEMVKKKCVLDVAAYNVRLMGIDNSEDVKGIIELMKKEELIPDTISYNYLMTCYCKYGIMKEARKVYDEMEGNGCKANAATFRTLVFHYCRFGNFDKGYEVFKESVAVNKIPDFHTLQHLVRGLVSKSKMKDAKGMCRTVKKKFPATVMNSWRKLEEELRLFVNSSSSAEENRTIGS